MYRLTQHYTIKLSLFSVVHVFMTLESLLRFSLLSTNVAVPDKVFGKMFALNVTQHIRLPTMAETTDAFIPTFRWNSILSQVFIASHRCWVKPCTSQVDNDEMLL